MKSLQESLFDNDLVQKRMLTDGTPVDEKLWGKCEKSFDWIRKTLIGNKDNIKFSASNGHKYEIEYNVIYNQKDCVLLDFIGEDGNKGRRGVELCIISPETIYYNYINDSLRQIQVGGNELDHSPRCNIYSYSFAKRSSIKANGNFYALEYTSGIFGYCPATISTKAQKIINEW